nr:MAG TPA: hypothetical protein [Caudoviricetes sp.]
MNGLPSASGRLRGSLRRKSRGGSLADEKTSCRRIGRKSPLCGGVDKHGGLGVK